LYAKANDVNETEVVKSYIVYLSSSYASLGTAPLYVIAAADVKNFQLSFSQSQIPSDWTNCYIAISSVDKENNESKVSNVVRLAKTNEGWVIAK
jgi:hypothetical protein